MAIAQTWAPLRGDDKRCLIAEVRWVGGRSTGEPWSGELRFGIDFWLKESRAAREESWQLARAMDAVLRADSFIATLERQQPHLASLLRGEGAGRPRKSVETDPQWNAVVIHGLSRSGSNGAVKGTRQTIHPGFYGNGTQRFEAKVSIDFHRASAADLVSLLTFTLTYLTTAECLPDHYRDVPRATQELHPA